MALYAQPNDEVFQLACDLPFFDGVASVDPLGFDSENAHDIGDDLLSITPMSGWDTPPHEASFDISLLEEPPTSSFGYPALGADDTFMHNPLLSLTPPASPPRSEFDCDASQEWCGSPSVSDDESLAPTAAGSQGKAKLGRGMKKVKASKGDKAAKLRAIADAALAESTASTIAAAAAKVNEIRDDESESSEDPETKRLTHNVLERKRRNDLKTSYSALRAQIPTLEDSDRVPTGQILLHAVNRIEALRAEEVEIMRAIARAREENARLLKLRC